MDVEWASEHAGVQVLPMVLARSSSNYPFKATFHETNQPRFQDGVIDALTSMAKVVPDGMLVFMPSYGMLNKLVTRWEQTSTPCKRS